MPRAFAAYQELRKPNADAIASLALQNFVEMRDLVGDADFLHKKHVEHELTELYPHRFRSQYELVAFSQEPYKFALDQGGRNNALLEHIISNQLESKLSDAVLMEKLMDQYL
jgi:kynurenine 3-monooxygenase